MGALISMACADELNKTNIFGVLIASQPPPSGVYEKDGRAFLLKLAAFFLFF